MMRIAITGATGFVGGNIAEVLVDRGHEVTGLVRREPKQPLPWQHRLVDFSSTASIAVALSGADAVVHCAIANDFHMLLNDRPGAYDAYVGMTQRVTRAAVAAGATPSLASEIGAEVERVIKRRATGTFHLVGDDAVGRMDLARLVCDVFALDDGLLDEIDAPVEQRFPQAVPVDTSLDNARTKQVLGLEATPLRALLGAFRQEMESGALHPLTR